MSDLVLERVVKDIIFIAQKNHAQKVEFTWHGGEPTLAGLDFYQKAVQIQKREVEGTGIDIDNNIQTNGTLINEKWAEFCKTQNFSFGVSLDGPKWLHDQHRHYVSGRGSFGKVINCINILKQYSIPFGVLAVVTDSSIGHAKEIMDFFIANEIYQFDFSPCAELPGTTGVKYTISPQKYAEFMKEAFEHWLSYDNPKIEIRFLKQAIFGLMGAEPGLCSMGHNYCGVFPTITPNGDVFFCDNYEGSEDMFLGNLLKTPLYELIFEPHQRHTRIRTDIMNAKKACRDCEWYDACGGGCPRYTRTGINQPFNNRNYFCNAYRNIMSYVAKRVIEITNAHNIKVPHPIPRAG